MITIKELCGGYGDKEILHQVSLNLEPGKVTALIGPNGCGKSTLLKTLVGINSFTAGEILVNNRNIKEMKTAELAKSVAYLPQNKKTPDISVLRLVLHGRFAYLNYPRKYSAEDIRIAKAALRWAGLEDLAEENVGHLSGGMQQKVYIAMALAQNADMILLDEPAAFLDVAQQLKLLDMTKQLAGEGKGVVLVLHDLSQALRTADMVVLMQDGRAVSVGTPEQIYESGRLQEVFGVQIERVQTESGWHYVCNAVD
ncbi:MAG: ABC transporter ATP-binding protein [Lachnospiraceae bacterium]|nr:ABC transporter ATP-binding protein [Lachnospiraceae bacterium]